MKLTGPIKKKLTGPINRVLYFKGYLPEVSSKL